MELGNYNISCLGLVPKAHTELHEYFSNLGSVISIFLLVEQMQSQVCTNYKVNALVDKENNCLESQEQVVGSIKSEGGLFFELG